MMSDHIRELSIRVYKLRLDAANPGAVDRMLAKDADDGQKLSGVTMTVHRTAGYQPGINWPLIIVLALSLSIWITAGAMVWWLI